MLDKQTRQIEKLIHLGSNSTIKLIKNSKGFDTTNDKRQPRFDDDQIYSYISDDYKNLMNFS